MVMLLLSVSLSLLRHPKLDGQRVGGWWWWMFVSMVTFNQSPMEIGIALVLLLGWMCLPHMSNTPESSELTEIRK